MFNYKSDLKLAWRVSLPNYDTDSAFSHLLDFARENKQAIDEIALFDSITHHLYIPLDIYRERATRMGECMRAVRDAGIASVGINVLATLGHINEAWDTMPVLPFQPMVGHDGAISTGCACPNTPELRAYVQEKYRLVAMAEPAFVWVDDDIRMQHHGVRFACFCPTCMKIFSDTVGEVYTRESLVAALNMPERADVRAAWIEHNIRTITSLLDDVAVAIHQVDPDIETGLMTAGPGWTTYTGVAFDKWMNAMHANRLRPGGGFYTDANRLEILDKAIDVGRQRAIAPVGVNDCQYELENFPYQALKKSVNTVMHECTLALANGLNGIAFNALGMWEGSLDAYKPIANAAQKNRPMWQAMVKHADGMRTNGLWVAWNSQLMARRNVREGEDWFSTDAGYEFNRAHVLAQIGLPLCVDRPAANQPGSATVLYGKVAEAFTDAELIQMLSGGVMLDSTALNVLTQRGLERYAGVCITRRIDNGAMERLTNDPLNGAYAGEVRDARIEFWGDARGMADVLEPIAPEVRVLATLEDYFRCPIGACMTAYENELGGRVVVMGYAPWIFLHSHAKRTQLVNIADWITHDTLTVRIDEVVALTPFVRCTPDGSRGMLVLLNTGLEPIERATVHLRTKGALVHQLTPDDAQPISTTVTVDETGCQVVLNSIGAWSTVVLVWG